MEKNENKKKILIGIIVITIVAGIIIAATTGFKFDLKYEKSDEIYIMVGDPINVQEIKEIVEETIPNKETIVQTVEVFEDTLKITAEEITEEEKTNTLNKINEKYQKSLVSEDVVTLETPHTRGRDILEPYILPFSISTILIIAYMAIRYRKKGTMRIVMELILSLILTQTLLFSVMAIAQIPIGRLTLPLMLIVYTITIMGCTIRNEKKTIEE